MNRNAVQQASVSCIFQGKAQAVEEICSNMLLIVTAVVLSSPQFVGCKPLHRSFILKKKKVESSFTPTRECPGACMPSKTAYC